MPNLEAGTPASLHFELGLVVLKKAHSPIFIDRFEYEGISLYLFVVRYDVAASPSRRDAGRESHVLEFDVIAVRRDGILGTFRLAQREHSIYSTDPGDCPWCSAREASLLMDPSKGHADARPPFLSRDATWPTYEDIPMDFIGAARLTEADNASERSPSGEQVLLFGVVRTPGLVLRIVTETIGAQTADDHYRDEETRK